MGGERASGVAQLAGRAGGRTRPQERNDRSNNNQEGTQDGGDRPGHGGSHPHERQDRHNDGRGDGGERVGEENLDAVDVLRHAVHDVTRIQAVRARGGLRFKLVVEVVAQHRQAVEGHEVSGELLEVAGTALEEAEDHGAHNNNGDRPRAGAGGQARDRPAPQGEQADADHEEDDARHNGGDQRRQDASSDRQEPKRELPAGHRIIPSWSVATRSAPLMVASR